MMNTLLDHFNPLKPGDRIIYSYEHTLNGKSKTIITKHGVFARKVRHPRRYWLLSYRKQMAVVKFIGNKNESRVEYAQLAREPQRRMSPARIGGEK